MNYNARNGATNWPVSLKNEATPDAVVFSGAATSPTDGAVAGFIPAAALGRGGLYCNRTTTMKILKRRRISIERANAMNSLVLYGKDMGITNLIWYLTYLSPNGEEDIDINLVHDTTWMIQNP